MSDGHPRHDASEELCPDDALIVPDDEFLRLELLEKFVQQLGVQMRVFERVMQKLGKMDPGPKP